MLTTVVSGRLPVESAVTRSPALTLRAEIRPSSGETSEQNSRSRLAWARVAWAFSSIARDMSRLATMISYCSRVITFLGTSGALRLTSRSSSASSAACLSTSAAAWSRAIW